MNTGTSGCIKVPVLIIGERMPIALPSAVIYAHSPGGGLSSADNPMTVPGRYAINSPFSYNTFSKAPINLPVAGVFGRVNGNIIGDLVIHADNTYTFTGHYTLNKDIYDADKSNRSYWQETLTTFLHDLGNTFGHVDYTINIIGTQPVVFSGRK
ncbi:lipid II-degrading bacteriocin [Pseudomonas syringae]|nr:lipid II-degrading bacteriocin [Pseudomonas syringae]